MAQLKLSSPWVIFYRELDALFKDDPEVHVVYDEDEVTVKLFVDSADKAGALTALLPHEKEFGDVTLKVMVVPANLGATYLQGDELFNTAFRGNPAFSFLKTVTGVFFQPLIYVVFRNQVVQYFNDSLGDIYGLCSTLYQDIAKDVFVPMDNVFYCTDLPEVVKQIMTPVEYPW